MTTVMDVVDDDVAAPAAKRSKHSPRHDEEAYVPGAIMRVEMHNFMTHRDVVFEPGPRLNVILGPNGTGKSAFVCAVCIGLGGHPKLLGRAGQLGEFVKRGEDSAYTEIALRGRKVGQPIVVRREFKNRDGGSSVWRLNGVVVKYERVMSEMAGLNMQLNNLCSFLPQDRVVAFSTLNPQELLIETEKAIGNAEMFNEHEQLKAMKEAIRDLERSVEQKKNRMEKLTRDNEALQRDVDRLQERDDLIKEADAMSSKIPWLQFESQKEQFMLIKNAHEAQKQKVLDIRAEHAKHQPKHAEIDAMSKESVARVSAIIASHNATKDKIKRCDGKFTKLSGEQDALDRKLAGERKDASELKEKIQRRLRMIRENEEELKNVPEVPTDLADRLKDVKDRSNAKNDEMRSVEMKIQDLRAQVRPHQQAFEGLKDQLRRIDSVRDKKVEQLSKHRHFARLKEADDWVQSKKQAFHGRVFGPLIAEIEVSDPVHQNMIEQHLGPHVLGTFIVTDPRDERMVSEQMKKYNINVWMPRQINNFVPGVISSELRNAGVLCTMDNVFKADPIVKQSLNDTHRICRVHVGDNSLTSSSVNDIFQAGLSDNIYCAKGVYMHRRSRYDRSASTMSQSELRPSRLFVSESSTSRQDIVNKLAQAEKKYREVDDEIKALTQQSVGIRQELQQITNDRKILNMKAQEPEAKRKKLLTKISHNKQLLKEDEKAASVEDIEKRYEEQSKKLTGNRVEAAIDLIDQVLLSHKICSEANVECLIGVERLVRTQRQTEIISAIELRFTAEREKRDDFKERLKTARDQLAAKKQEAMDIAPLTPEIQEQFARWPKTIEELDNEIKTKREQADAILCQNPSALEEYKNRTKEMSDLTKALETESSLLAGKQSEIQVVKDRWLPKLQRIIAKISERFADNFAHIACAGQITLAGDGSREHGGFGDEFKDYSLEIRVKFRANEEMHLLDSHRQSGGERSVSTMLYMIALQGFTSAPFRVVDEINQGMDARNERKVFKRMVEAASVPGTPQCFVVTPKLLTQLTYSEDCTVMCIFNGPHVHQMASRWREMQAAFDAKKVPTPTR